jgi:hypothetical protein
VRVFFREEEFQKQSSSSMIWLNRLGEVANQRFAS